MENNKNKWDVNNPSNEFEIDAQKKEGATRIG